MKQDDKPSLTTELLIMPDGRILVHNLTRPFAELLKVLNPDDEQIVPRAAQSDSRFTPQVSRP
jgi:hypothetical protein